MRGNRDVVVGRERVVDCPSSSFGTRDNSENTITVKKDHIAITQEAAPGGGTKQCCGCCCAARKEVNYSLTAAPLGLMAFGTTTFMLSMINAHIITDVPNVIVGPALAYGGLIQILTAMWDIKSGNALSACVSGSFGAFWVSTGINYMPVAGVTAAYTPDGFVKATGVQFVGMVCFAAMMMWASLRTTVASIILWMAIVTELGVLAAGFIQVDYNLLKIGGYLGMCVGAGAWYQGMVFLLQPELSWVQLPVGKLHW